MLINLLGSCLAMLNTRKVFILVRMRWPHKRPSGNGCYFAWEGESCGFPVKAPGPPRLSAVATLSLGHMLLSPGVKGEFSKLKNLNLIQIYSEHLPKAYLIHLMRELAGCIQTASKRIQSTGT